MRGIKCAILLLICNCTFNTAFTQRQEHSFFTPSDSFNKHRVFLATSFTISAYSMFSIGLYQAWYKQTERSKFHTFNDWGEWKYMDKLGHLYDAYFQSDLCTNGARWAGIKKARSNVLGMSLAMAFMSTIEVYDAYSNQWGFSWTDMASNVVGLGFFYMQEKLWQEQKLYLKFSSYPVHYKSQDPIIQERVKAIYGNSLGEKLLKDYNAQTYWLSFNPTIFFHKKTKWPEYINIALGYGAKGMLGGYENKWKTDSGVYIDYSDITKRENQYYLSFDLDWRKIPVRSPFLKSVFSVVNIFKVPAPALIITDKMKIGIGF